MGDDSLWNSWCATGWQVLAQLELSLMISANIHQIINGFN
ncbi:hypothetical protein VCR12J2_680052 [Vibrio coralliirubri]|nr:hypothetical protein VCR12J2_680052 [Vibrio coralliirubri]